MHDFVVGDRVLMYKHNEKNRYYMHTGTVAFVEHDMLYVDFDDGEKHQGYYPWRFKHIKDDQNEVQQADLEKLLACI